MFFLRVLRSHPEFRLGLRDMLPQAPGIAAWGLMTGVAMVKSGLSVLESSAMSLLVFAGSSQLASLPLLIAGAPAWVILTTGFCVNLRFVVFSLHLRAYLMHLPLVQRLGHGYLTADLSYVLLTRRFPHPAQEGAGQRAQEAYLAGSCTANWISWVGASMVGVALANVVPTHWGLGFAGILCLVGILCSLATTRLRIVSAIVAGTAAIVAYALPLKLNIVVAIAVAVLACLALRETGPVRRGARMSGTTDLWTLSVIVGLACVTVVARSFFFISSKPWHLPSWAERGLQYAPIAALSAVVVPEVLTTQGEFLGSWQDARVFAALAGAAAFAWRKNVLLTIVAGMAVYLPLRLGLGW